MKPLVLAAALIVTCTGIMHAQDSAAKIPIYVIEKPTIIAFFPPVSESDLDKDVDLNEVLADFQLYTSELNKRLRNSGIDFLDTNARQFRILLGNRVTPFNTGKIGIGYYFVAPGKKPHVEYGVMTDGQAVEVARRYFGIAIP